MNMSYSDLLNVSDFGEKRESTFPLERGDVCFYCRDCKECIEAIELPPQKEGKRLREYRYACPECKGMNISIGTLEGLKEFYHKK